MAATAETGHVYAPKILFPAACAPGRMTQMDPQATLAAAQALLGVVLLSFVPLVLATLLHPSRGRGRR